MNNIDFSIFNISNKRIIKLISFFLGISFFICFTGIVTLYIYNRHYISIDLYKASIIIFRTGLLAGIFSIICGLFFNKYINEIK